jgi:hypothetical protein
VVTVRNERKIRREIAGVLRKEVHLEFINIFRKCEDCLEAEEHHSRLLS